MTFNVFSQWVRKSSQFNTNFQLITLWHWLPERMTMGTPELIYASNEHGISLNTFYTKSEPWEPTILVIKTTTREVSHFPISNWSVCTVLKNMAITVVKRWSKAESLFIFENPFRFLALIVHLLGRHVMWKMTRVTDNSILVPVNRFCSRLVKKLQANILGSTLKTTVKVGGHFNLRLNTYQIF